MKSALIVIGVVAVVGWLISPGGYRQVYMPESEPSLGGIFAGVIIVIIILLYLWAAGYL